MVKYKQSNCMVMTVYNYEYEECAKCHKYDYCIEWTYTHRRTTKTAYYCRDCFGWLPIEAKIKDNVLSDIRNLEN